LRALPGWASGPNGWRNLSNGLIIVLMPMI
jgi:hypothetical protein